MTDARPVPEKATDRTEDREFLEARLELLAEENRRLRESHGRLRRTRHRRTALGLLVVGSVGLAGAVAFPDVRTVLVALGATGVFGGLLTWYLTPERFVAAAVGERTYAALAENEARLVAELGLRDDRLYVPLTDHPTRRAVLFVPQAGEYGVPDAEALESAFVLTEDPADRGVALYPTGGPLLAELLEGLPGGLAAEPVTICDQVADGLREGFELVDVVRTDVDAEAGRASVAVGGSAWGAVDRFDHPVASLVAVGLAVGLGAPVSLEVAATPEARQEYLVTARWSVEDTPGPPADEPPG